MNITRTGTIIILICSDAFGRKFVDKFFILWKLVIALVVNLGHKNIVIVM
jgi:hypothetical protein